MKAAYLWRAAYACVITALLFGLFANWAYDDPFITFRYAENLALGNGFVFNLGERVLSTTTPLFTLILAVARFVTTDLQRAANFISASAPRWVRCVCSSWLAIGEGQTHMT